MSMSKILVVDGDAEVLMMIEQLLEREGHEVEKARSAQAAITSLESETPELFVINATLPGLDGVALCRKLRLFPDTSSVPIIVLTERDSAYSVAEVLDAGGDDSLRKPFALRELAARIRAQLRRSATYSILNNDMPTLYLSPATNCVHVDNREVVLTQVEFDLLWYLCLAPHQLHTTGDLLTHVWQYPRGTGDAALVRNHVRNLRRKLEPDPDHPAIIQSRHGRGYVVRAHIQIEERVAHGA
jgi:DNA-binding response OmpR family regulator